MIRQPPRSALGRLGAWSHRRRWFVLGLWLAALVVFGGVLTGRFTEHTVAEDHTIGGSESTHAEQLLDERFDQPVDEIVLVTIDTDDRVTDTDFEAGVVNVADAIRAADIDGVVSVTRALAPTDAAAGSLRAAVLEVGVAGSADTIEAAVQAISVQVHGTALESGQAHVTGETAVGLAADELGESDLARAELIGLPVAALVLLLAFGSVMAALLPLALAITGVAVTLGVLGVLTIWTDFVGLTENATTLIGLGIGIDFAMFIVARYREAHLAGRRPEDAAAIALATSGRAVAFSAGTVIVSVTGLFLVDSPIFHDLALGAMVTTAVMLLAALTMLPAFLGVFGRLVLRRRDRHPTAPAPGLDTTFWSRWATRVMQRPAASGGAAALILIVLALPLTRLDLGQNDDSAAIADSDAGAGLAVLEQIAGPGYLAPIEIVLASDTPLDAHQLEAIHTWTGTVEARSDVDATTTIANVMRNAGLPLDHTGIAALQRDPAAANIVNRNADVTVATVIADGDVDGPAAETLVKELRRSTGELRRTGLDVAITGQTARTIDLTHEVTDELPNVLAYVVGISFILLVLVFRSPLLALKAIIMNALSVGAAFGLLVLAFQDHDGTIQAWLPLVAFAVLFGISMDYEVFLLGRIREAWDQTHDNTYAVATGLAHTARPITSAAAIQIAVFGAFTFTSISEVRQLGFVLAVAIFLDATLVRTVLVPATMRLLGAANWWAPRWIPHLGLDPHHPAITGETP